MQPIQRLHAKIVVLRSDLVATCRAFALVRYIASRYTRE
jgi:hypothetical protein